MIDYFSLALTHGLIFLALWRLAFRPELDAEGPDAEGLAVRARRKSWVKGDAKGNLAAPEAGSGSGSGISDA